MLWSLENRDFSDKFSKQSKLTSKLDPTLNPRLTKPNELSQNHAFGLRLSKMQFCVFDPVSGFTSYCDICELIILDSLNIVLVDHYYIGFLCNLFIYRIQWFQNAMKYQSQWIQRLVPEIAIPITRLKSNPLSVTF